MKIMHTDCEIPTQSFFVCSQSTKGVFKKYQFPSGNTRSRQTVVRLCLTEQSNQNHDICTETFWGEIVDNPGMKNAHLLMSVILDHWINKIAINHKVLYCHNTQLTDTRITNGTKINHLLSFSQEISVQILQVHWEIFGNVLGKSIFFSLLPHHAQPPASADSFTLAGSSSSRPSSDAVKSGIRRWLVTFLFK